MTCLVRGPDEPYDHKVAVNPLLLAESPGIFTSRPCTPCAPLPASCHRMFFTQAPEQIVGGYPGAVCVEDLTE